MTNVEKDALAEALELAELYQGESASVRGVLSKGLLELASRTRPEEQARKHGVLVARQTWLADTERIQREVFRLEPRTVAYARDQLTGAMVELAECLQELPWKAARDGLVNQSEREDIAAVVRPEKIRRAQKELIDAMHFIANVAVSLGLADDDMWQEYNRVSCHNVDKRRRAEDAA